MMFTISTRRIFVVLLLADATAGVYVAGSTPSALLYQSDVALTDQNGRVFHLMGLRGKPVLVSMFCTSCQMVCPMTFETIRIALAKGGKPAHDGVQVLMVTVDPERDSAAALEKTASAHGTDDHQQVTRTSTSGTHEVTALLGVQYRRSVNDNFNHSNTILLPDAKGHINTRINTLGAVDPELVGAIRKLVVAQR